MLVWGANVCAPYPSHFGAYLSRRFKPYSKYPPCYKDIAFWTSDSFTENNLCEMGEWSAPPSVSFTVSSTAPPLVGHEGGLLVLPRHSPLQILKLLPALPIHPPSARHRGRPG